MRRCVLSLPLVCPYQTATSLGVVRVQFVQFGSRLSVDIASRIAL